MTLHVSPTAEATGVRRVARGFALALSAALVAGAVSVAAPAAAAATTYTVSGHVTAAATGAPVEDIEVTLYPEFDPADEESMYPIDYRETTATGGYSFKNVKPGKYRVAFENYYGDFNLLSQFAGGEPGDMSGDVESFVVSASTTVDQALVAGGAISGRVLDAAGKAVYAGISAVPTDGGLYSAQVSSTETDKSGRFTAGGLLPGSYTLYVSGTTKAKLANSTFVVGAVDVGETVDAGTLTLGAGSTVVGTARKSNSSVYKNALLMAFRIAEDGTTDGVPYSYAETNARGEFQLPNLPVGDFVIADYNLLALLTGGSGDFAGGGDDLLTATTVSIGTASTKVYRDIRFEKSAQISGKLTDAAGKAAAKSQVVAVRNDYSPLYNTLLGLDTTTDEGIVAPIEVLAKALKEQVDARPAALTKMLEKAGLPASTPISVTTTASNGTYTLPDVALGGSYTVYFDGSASRSSALYGATAGVSAHVTSTKTAINAKLSRTVTVSGVVTSASGTPIKGVYVEGIRTDEAPVGDERAATSTENIFYTGHYTTTDSKGRYTLRLPADKWSLWFSDEAQKLSPRFLGGGTYPTDPKTTILDTTVSSYRAQNIVLGNSGATITGAVTTSTGSSVVNGDILIDRVVNNEVVDTLYVYNTDADDYYFDDQLRLRRIVDGDYRLRFIPLSFSDSYEFPVTTVELTVAGGQLASVNGEAPAVKNSLGTIVLDAVERITPLADAELTVLADGPLAVGTTLHADFGAAENSAQDVDLQWYRDGSPIGSAFARDYVIQPGDIGTHLSFQTLVSYTLVSNVGAKTSPATEEVQGGEFPLESGSPTIEGSGAIGSLLTAVPAGDPTVEYKYQWRINGVAYLGATASTFTPRVDSLGDTISVAATPKSGEDAGTWVTSNRVVVVPGSSVVKESSTASVLVGGKAMNTSRLGAVLTTKTNLPADSLVLSYQWEYATTGTNWKPLAGKDRPTLTLSKKTTSTSKIGYSYRVVVTAERSGTEAGPVVTSKAVKVTKAAKK